MNPINSQTPGPVKANFSAYHGSYTLLCAQTPDSSRYVGTVQVYQTPRIMGLADEKEREANARLLAASYACFDKAGRTLGVDAAELAEKLDLAALISAAHAARLSLPDCDARWALARALNKLPSV